MILKTSKQIERMAELGKIIAEIVKNLHDTADIGLSPQGLNQKAAALCKEFGVNPSCKGFQGYPAETCIGINSQAVHNIPSNMKFKDGDIVTIDIVIDRDGWFVDHAVTKMIGDVDQRGRELVESTQRALNEAIKQVKVGKTLGDIGAVVEGTVKPLGFNVLRNFVGHGIGQHIHEEPIVPCFGEQGKGKALVEGMVFTIEPMVAEFSAEIEIDKADGWSTKLKDGGRFAMFEHTIALSSEGARILTKK